MPNNDGGEIIWHLLDTNECEVQLKDSKFNPEKDPVSVSIDYIRTYGFPIMPSILIKYDNEVRILDLFIHEGSIMVDGYGKKFDGYGSMYIYTLYEKKPNLEIIFPEGFYHEGSLELFYQACDIDLKRQIN